MPQDKQKLFDEKYTLLLIITTALILRLWNISWGLPFLYDEAIPFRISWKFWNWGFTGLDLNPHFFTYPAFTFYFQYLIQSIQYIIGFALGFYNGINAFQQSYISNPDSYIIIARLITILFDVGTVTIVYYIAKMFADRPSAVIASLLTAINILHIKESHLINVDTPLTFFSVLSFLFIGKIYFDSARKWYILAGISIGLATATKYNGAFLILVLLAATALRSRSIDHIKQLFTNKRLYLSIALSIIIFFLFNPYILIDFQNFKHDIQEVRMHMETGHLGLEQDQSAGAEYFLVSLPNNLGWILVIVSVCSLIYLLSKRKKNYYVLLSYPIIYLIMVILQKTTADRYILPVIPMLLVSSAIGIIAVWNMFEENILTKRSIKLFESSGKRIGLLLIVVIVISYPSISGIVTYQLSHRLPDTRTIAREWIVNNVKVGSAIATGPFGIPIPEDQYIMLYIPFNAGATESTAPFYDQIFYTDLDFIITSDYDYGRYLKEPTRFKNILSFYDTLHSSWKLTKEIKPSVDQNGPTFWIYKPLPSSQSATFRREILNHTFEIADSTIALNFIGRLGMILSYRGKYDKSRQLLQLVTRIAPENFQARREYINVLTKVTNENEILTEIDSYLNLNESDAEILALRGNILTNQKRLVEAEGSLRRAIEINPLIETAYINLSIVYALSDEREKLISTLQQLYKILPPGSLKAKQVEQQLQQLINE